MTMKGNGKAEQRFEANITFKGKKVNFRARRPDPKDENNYQAFQGKVPKRVRAS